MEKSGSYELGELLYENALNAPSSIADFRMEGQAVTSFPLKRLRMENALDPELGQQANFVLWCPERFPEDIAVSWDFWPLREPGLCILFFAASGQNGKDLFDPGLNSRQGIYDQYHHGEMDAYHVSYFRRKQPDERVFHTCNLRKSYGFHLVAQGADPIPSAVEAKGPYRIELHKCGGDIRFFVNDLPIFQWLDDSALGPVLGGGYIGFRQMAPLIAEYANLKVHALRRT